MCVGVGENEEAEEAGRHKHVWDHTETSHKTLPYCLSGAHASMDPKVGGGRGDYHIDRACVAMIIRCVVVWL